MHCAALAKLTLIWILDICSLTKTSWTRYLCPTCCMRTYDSDNTKRNQFSDPDSVVSVDPESRSGSRQARIIPIRNVMYQRSGGFFRCMDVFFRGLMRNIYPNFACNFFSLITNLRLYPYLANCLDPDANPNRQTKAWINTEHRGIFFTLISSCEKKLKIKFFLTCRRACGPRCTWRWTSAVRRGGGSWTTPGTSRHVIRRDPLPKMATCPSGIHTRLRLRALQVYTR